MSPLPLILVAIVLAALLVAVPLEIAAFRRIGRLQLARGLIALLGIALERLHDDRLQARVVGGIDVDRSA